MLLHFEVMQVVNMLSYNDISARHGQAEFISCTKASDVQAASIYIDNLQFFCARSKFLFCQLCILMRHAEHRIRRVMATRTTGSRSRSRELCCIHKIDQLCTVLLW